MLMVFETVRKVGTSLLASAGLIGIVAGIAAQRSLANLFAGVQLALTQPILLGTSLRWREITASWNRSRLAML
jgi:small-conductance mechanosensitive channel